MRITIIVGSTNFKTNGVAAYAKIFGEQLLLIGHDVIFISLNETHPKIENKVFDLAKKYSFIKRYFTLKNKLKDLNPDYVSIQYVPYSFQRRGLPLEFLFFSFIFKKYKIHLMVHEPWIDVNRSTVFKNILVSKLQSFILKKIISIVDPILITTTIPHYVSMLGSKARMISLFSNISFHEKLNIVSKDYKEFKCIFFGNFSLDTDGFISQLAWIKQYCILNNLIPKFTLVGGNGPHKSKYAKYIKEILGEANFVDLGWLSEKEISFLFQTQNLGVSRATYTHFGKSGSTLAMLEHGLPVLLRGNKIYQKVDENLYDNQFLYTNTDFEVKIERVPPYFNAKSSHIENFERLINEAILHNRRNKKK